MSASLAVVSFPGVGTSLLTELTKTSLPLLVRRELCSICQKERLKLTEKWILSLKQPLKKATCSPKRSFSQLKIAQTTEHFKTTGSLPYDSKTSSLRSWIASSSLLINPALLPLSSFHTSRHFHSGKLALSTHNGFNNTSTQTSPAIDPFKMMEPELEAVMKDVGKVLNSKEPALQHMSLYYFNGKGKTFRPLVSLLMAKACNIHTSGEHSISWQQKIVAVVSEMIHTASLVHDDVIDSSDTRRSLASLNTLYGQRQAILTGDYILSQASIAVARTKHPQVISILASILVDLVNGEFMQLGSKENESERFSHYFDKTYKKTASLIANCCKSVALLGNCNEEIAESSFQYGKNLGLAFQLIDDLLDFTSCDKVLGKPTAADLKQGLATAPVLFAAQEFPELHAMIMRRFSQDGDIDYTRNAVEKSQGVEQTRLLASQHSKEAVRCVTTALADSEPRAGLIRLAQILLDRTH